MREPPLHDWELRVVRGIVDEHLVRLDRGRPRVSIAAVVAHSVISVCLIAAYVAVTLSGDDGTPVLYLLGGYIGGSGVGALAGIGGNGK